MGGETRQSHGHGCLRLTSDRFLSVTRGKRYWFAEGASGRRANVLEKDVWVVDMLRILFSTAYGDALTFKGGTSLSKVYGAISRFSEDIDVTYNIRSLVPDLVPDEGLDPIPPSRNQAGRWTGRIRSLLATWVQDEVAPAIQKLDWRVSGLPATLQAQGDSLIVAYTQLLGGYEFVQPRVLVEFGARATGEPREEHVIECDAAGHVPGVVFPTARPHVMSGREDLLGEGDGGPCFLPETSINWEPAVEALARPGQVGRCGLCGESVG